MLFKSSELYYGKKAFPRIFIESVQPVIGKNSILVCYGNKVGSDAHHYEIQKSSYPLKRHFFTNSISLNKFKTHPAPGQIIEGIITIASLGIKTSYRRRELFIRKVM